MSALLMNFQQKHIAKLVSFANELLSEGDRGVLLLQAPTGSGKTIMASQWMNELAAQSQDNLAFVWIAPNRLHEQSFKNMRAASEHLPHLRFLGVDSLQRSLAVGDVLFLNWDSVNKRGNLLRRAGGNEHGITIEEVMSSTREEGKKIVLVIDEAHVHLRQEAAQDVVQEIVLPDLTLEVSATPHLTGYRYKAEIKREEVIAEGLIRKQIVINPGLGSMLQTSAQSSTVTIHGDANYAAILREALNLRNRLARTYMEKGLAVNPLILVQFQDGPDSDDVMDSVSAFLGEHGITTDNGKLGIWLSEKKINLNNIEEPTGSQEVLFFKQAIALGWDCPRAQILVSLRELKARSFTAQVLGRILRQPLRRHFELELLDRAYVFTNVDSFELTQELENMLPSKEIKATGPFRLPLANWVGSGSSGCVARRSLREAIVTRAEPLIEDQRLHYRGPVYGSMVADLVINDPDREVVVGAKDKRDYVLGIDELEVCLRSLTRKLTKGFKNSGDARRYVRGGIVDIGSRISGIAMGDGMDEASRMKALEAVLHTKNAVPLESCVTEAIASFIAEEERNTREFEEQSEWLAKESLTVRVSLPNRWRKSLYACYGEPPPFTDIELALAEHFEADPNVDVWIKNGNNGRDWFALSYEMDGDTKLFYPDFLVRKVDGSFVVAEGKGAGPNGTASHPDTKHKAERLQAWAASQRDLGHAVTGYIAVLSEPGGDIFINDSDEYRYHPETLCGWRKLTKE